MHVGDIVRGDSAETIAGRLREFMKGDSAGFESIFHRKDGNQVEVEVTISYLATRNLYYCFHRDITERKRAEADLRRSQKLESLGLLAGGIAHDFNNLLGGIYGYIDLAVETMAESEAKDELAKALKTIDRARGLTRQLLTFAKGGDPVLRVESLFPLVKETAQFALSGSNVSLSCQVADGLRPCRFDRNQIAQVVDNIVINAVQAMPGGGRLTITAANVDIEPGKHPLLEVGQYVCISFEDSGIGMPGDILPRVFDPFYTTKSTGHGLGLATCYSIIKRHGGIIEVESEPNKGSTFRVYLPTECHGESLDAEVPGEVRHRGTGTVLVVDDEVVVQETIAGMLRSFGYRVECVSDGAAAIATLEKQFAAGEISTAVILDLTVPGGMGGKEAAEEMGRRWPALPLFVASGYAEDPVMARPTAYGFVASIRKPFTRSELAAVLEQGLFRTANFWRSSI
jgi:signal transduction histidine kinase/CheY-like chemotaxis protein